MIRIDKPTHIGNEFGIARIVRIVIWIAPEITYTLVAQNNEMLFVSAGIIFVKRDASIRSIITHPAQRTVICCFDFTFRYFKYLCKIFCIMETTIPTHIGMEPIKYCRIDRLNAFTYDALFIRERVGQTMFSGVGRADQQTCGSAAEYRDKYPFYIKLLCVVLQLCEQLDERTPRTAFERAYRMHVAPVAVAVSFSVGTLVVHPENLMPVLRFRLTICQIFGAFVKVYIKIV